MSFYSKKCSTWVKIRPYFGLAPAIIIERWKEEIKTDVILSECSDVDPDLGFNLFTGADLFLNPSMYISAEFRGKFGDWDLFKMTIGLGFLVGGNS
jgi:hypothetical protein